MKKVLYCLAMILVGMTSCISFDDPVTENYGTAPGIDVTVTPGEQTDSAFTVTITPSAGAAYYAYVIDKNDVPEELDSAVLYKGGYGNTVVKVADQPSTTIVITEAEPNTTYQVYAVAGSDKGIVGRIVTKSITTTDRFLPIPQRIGRDGDIAAVMLTYSENITRGEGAVTAKYYKEWDIMNPVEVPAEDIHVAVEQNAVIFGASNIPAGAYVCYSYAEGAFLDSKGNPCPALTSGLDLNKGTFVGAWVQKTSKPFAIEDAWVTAPENGALIGKVDDFKGEITFPFNIYRNDETVEKGDLSVTFKNANRSVTYNLSPEDWSVAENKLNFALPASVQPVGGDIITVNVVEGAVADVYGNLNEAFSSTTSWKFFAPTVDMILGNFDLNYISYWSDDNTVDSFGTLTFEQNPNSENGLIISGTFDLFEQPTAIEAYYDLSAGKIYIPDMQVLGFYTSSSGAIYGLIFATADGTDAAAFTINADGTMTADGLWGIYALDENFENEIGWFEVAKVSQFSPAKAAARKVVAKAKKAVKSVKSNKKSVKINKKARSLKKHIRK